ncbi:WXG100 family type VII secretion target [Actinophytocola sp. NPDC049390]|uniref:WXG100 family type VII secretion target n=1 Tax=Actinophytocola sp. NPDC049390 TaxID=3363894 RepID=UPI00378DB697
MSMTPQEIYENFHHGSSRPLADVARELREVVPVYEAVSDRLMALGSGMTSVWSGDAADASITKAESLVTSMRRSVELLAACGGSHDAQTTAFDSAKEQVVPVPPVPEKPTPMDMIKEVLEHGPGAPFERVQTYRDAVAAYEMAAVRNNGVMETYYWATRDNQDIPDDYPRPVLSSGGAENSVTAEGDGLDWRTDRVDTIETGGEKTGTGPGDVPGGVGGDGGQGLGSGLDGSGPGGSGVDFDGPGGGGPESVDLPPPDTDGPGPGRTTPSWVPSTVTLPTDTIITDPARPLPPSGPAGPGVPPGVVVPGSTGTGRDRDPGATHTSGVSPVTGAFDPSKAGAPSAVGPGWGGGDQSAAGGRAGQSSGVGGGPAGGGVTGPAASRVPGSVGRTGGAGGFGMASPSARREEDEEHTRPEYLVEPDPNEIFGADQRASSPVIGAAWKPEPFDNGEG